MTRHKTITDEELLAVARRVFREHGHTATTREVAREAGISEGVLYQRFRTKEDLFFAAMIPREPDFDELLGPNPPAEDARSFFRHVLGRMAHYFADIIPLALQVITHPSDARPDLERAQPGMHQAHQALIARIESLARRGEVRAGSEPSAARLLMSLAHDWALGHAMHGPGAQGGTTDLEAMADIVWRGVQP